jgi:thioredoxin-dependent peroxiredoxin
VTDDVRLAPGDSAPDFTLSDADGKPVSLKDYRGQKVIVYFYPAAMTPGCTKEACDFRDNLSSLGGRATPSSGSHRTSRRNSSSSVKQRV